MNGVSYGNFFDQLFSIKYVPDLGEGSPPNEAKKLLVDVTIFDIFDYKITNNNMAKACLSGALLFFDLLAESHNLSQNINTKEGSFWHGIMHRKEGDFWNANYWFNQVGEHSVFSNIYNNSLLIETPLKDLKSEIKEMNTWNLEWFNNLVEKGFRERGDLEDFCIKIQEQEILLLFDYCYKNAVSV